MAQDKPTVLYVDDVPINLKLFEATFKKDYDIILTESPKEVLDILKKQEIQVLISDQRMPEMSGTELLEIVSVEHPDIRRYLLTAFTDAETVIEAVNKGRIHGYIKKPMEPDAIRQSINSSLEVYHLKKKNRQIMEELKSVNKELLNMDGLKSEIINSISNEISTPLNRIMGTLHLLKSKIEGDELSEVVNILDHSVFKLEQFSMLAKQISVLKSPGFQLKRDKVSIKQVIQFGSIETGEELKEQGISLKKNPESPDYVVEGDSGLLVSCLISLIRFAREHTENNGTIVIDSTMQDGQLACWVEDQGANYSDALFEVLSNHFSSSDTVFNLTMGIGLALSQMIMEAHGGYLIFEKTSEPRGCLKMVFP
ncbi:MAG: hybrid sensor histidine kinase/response regulator [Bacteroidales bacterium]|nr:hybrid sensor histidine kinase/response regulator [Bacteroidales bacterium]